MVFNIRVIWQGLDTRLRRTLARFHISIIDKAQQFVTFSLQMIFFVLNGPDSVRPISEKVLLVSVQFLYLSVQSLYFCLPQGDLRISYKVVVNLTYKYFSVLSTCFLPASLAVHLPL